MIEGRRRKSERKAKENGTAMRESGTEDEGKRKNSEESGRGDTKKNGDEVKG